MQTVATRLLVEMGMTIVILISLFLFSLGTSALFRRIHRGLERMPLAVSAAAGLVVLLHVAAVLTEFSLPGVFFSEALFWACSLAGVRELLVGERRLGSLGGKRILAAASVFIYISFFWAWFFRDNLGLPSYHDGVAHLSFFQDVLASGFAHLGRVPVHFSAEFGPDTQPFYPTGTHAVMAFVSGIWVRLGVLPVVLVKCWLVIANASMFFILAWGLRAYFPKLHWIAHVSVLMLAVLAFRFPLDASLEGALARILAFAIVFPLVIHATSERRFSVRQLAIAGALGFAPAFLLHPSTFWFFSFSLGFCVFWQVFVEKKDRLPLGTMLLLGLGAAVGAAELLYLFKSYAVDASFYPVPERPSGLAFVQQRLSSLFSEMLSGMFSPQRGLRAIYHLGLVAFAVYAVRRRLPGRSVAFHVTLLLFAVLIMLSEGSPIPGLATLGSSFYNSGARVSCMLYLSVWLFCALALDAFRGASVWLAARWRPALTERAALISGAALLLYGIQFQVVSWVRFPHIVASWNKEYSTPLYSRLGDLISWVAANTPANALLVAEPFGLDLVGPVTRRQGLFLYGEHSLAKLPALEARREWARRVLEKVSNRMGSPTPSEPCLEDELARMRAPLVILPHSEPGFQEMSLGERVCRDLEFRGVHSGRAILTTR